MKDFPREEAQVFAHWMEEHWESNHMEGLPREEAGVLLDWLEEQTNNVRNLVLMDESEYNAIFEAEALIRDLLTPSWADVVL